MTIQEAKGKLKVGMRVRCKGYDSSGPNSLFDGTVSYLSCSAFTIKRDDGVCGGGYEFGWLVPFSRLGATIEILTGSTEPEKKTMSSSIIEFFKNMAATPDDRLLKEHGIEDPIGTPTEAGLALSAQIEYKRNRAEIIEIVKKAAEARKEKS